MNKERGKVITHSNPHLKFGQIVTVLGFNEFSDELYVKSDVDNKVYVIHWTYIQKIKEKSC